jgi:glycine cleavage system transcriptional repressor
MDEVTQMAKKYLVATIIGSDKRGIVAKITDVVTSHQANIEDSRMARLGGEFAVIMLISLPNGNVEALSSDLAKLQSIGLTVMTRQTDLSRLKVFDGFVPYEISVIGADHEGIVHHVAEYLAEERIQVESMETHVTPAPVTGTPLFSMHTIVQAPPEVTFKQLREKLNALGDILTVDIDVRLPVD